MLEAATSVTVATVAPVSVTMVAVSFIPLRSPSRPTGLPSTMNLKSGRDDDLLGLAVLAVEEGAAGDVTTSPSRIVTTLVAGYSVVVVVRSTITFWPGTSAETGTGFPSTITVKPAGISRCITLPSQQEHDRVPGDVDDLDLRLLDGRRRLREHGASHEHQPESRARELPLGHLLPPYELELVVSTNLYLHLA